MSEFALPVPVIEYPYWRVNIRPDRYDPQLIPSLSECFALVQATKLSLRGWDYPHLSRRDTERGTGNNWVASWANFTNHIEYWRLYQSGQFLHLFAVREAASKEWHDQLRHAAQTHASHREDLNWNGVPGYLSMLNVVYTVTEIFEFAARIAQRGTYTGTIGVTIELKKIRGFVLTPELDRPWSEVRRASDGDIGRSWSFESRELLSASADLSLKACAWLFERFGWLEPSTEVLRRDQQKFLAGRL